MVGLAALWCSGVVFQILNWAQLGLSLCSAASKRKWLDRRMERKVLPMGTKGTFFDVGRPLPPLACKEAVWGMVAGMRCWAL